MNVTSSEPNAPKPLSDFAAHIRKTMTAETLAAIIEDTKPKVSGEVVLAEIEQLVEQAEGPLGK
jgi:hypothetical protein